MLKLTLVLLFIGVATSARVQLTDVKAILNEYLSQRLMSLPLNPKMRAAPDSQACYDKYLTLIQEAFEEGVKDSKVCTTTADENKNSELKQVEGERKSLDENVEAVQTSLTTCVETSEVIPYLSCLSGSSESNQQAINKIGEISNELLLALESKFEEIEEIEVGCVTGSIENSKEQADKYSDMLVNCVLYGETTPATTTTTTEETTVPTEGTTTVETTESTIGGTEEPTTADPGTTEPAPEGSGEIDPPESGEAANPNESNPEKHPESDLFSHMKFLRKIKF